MSTEIHVLRLGHRPERDKRLSTHVCLTARALGAKKVHVAGKADRVKRSVADVVDRWGGDFEVETGVRWRSLAENWRGGVAHLTMKGDPLPEQIEDIREHDRVLAVVGSEKVPSDMYGLADHNVAVTDQPHSEVAALAVFLDRALGKQAPVRKNSL